MDNEESSDEDELISEEPIFLEELGDGSHIELSSDIEIPIKKIRDTVKMFKNSPVYNDHLQRCIKLELGKKKQLLLDVRTRW